MSEEIMLLSPEELLYLQTVEDLNKPRGEGIIAGLTTRLHEGQISALKPLYLDKKRLLFLPCGRKFGKTEVAAYALYKQALTVAGSACYYITPEAAHGRKIVWDTWRLQNFLGDDGKKYIKSIKNVEMKVEFNNGSFIQVIGSENFGVANGLTPHIAVYDEFKKFSARWHIDFAPNLIPKAAPLIIIGTLPTPGDNNTDQYYEVLEAAKTDKSASVLFKTTFDNPLNLKEPQYSALMHEIEQLRKRGEEDVVQREYYSKIIAGGKRSIFPNFEQAKHVKPHETLLNHTKKDIHKLEKCLSLDPGTSTVFGGLFGVLNRYTGFIYILDEIYQKSQKETSTGVVLPICKEKMNAIAPMARVDDWLKISDDAAVWFMNEAINREDGLAMNFFPAEKWKGNREDGISLIKDLFASGKLVISDRCVNLIKEIEGYAVDGSGKISNKIPDHNIDALRYMLVAWGYDFNLLKETESFTEDIEVGRFRSPEHHCSQNVNVDYYANIAVDDGFDLSF